jgi:DNA-binding IclR family transcriptional regulator
MTYKAGIIGTGGIAGMGILDVHGLPATTDETIVDRAALYDRLDDVRERGVAFDDEERLEGLRCVAAPILAGNGRVEGAISVSGPSSRFRGELYRETLPNRLRQAVNIVELSITHG